MKIPRFLAATFFFFALVRGTSSAGQAGQASEPMPSQRRETSATESSSEGNKNSQAGGEKDQTSASLDQRQTSPAAGTRNTHKRRSANSPAKPMASHPSRSVKMPATNSTRASTPAHTMDFRQTGLSTSNGISNKAVSRNDVTHHWPTALLNGQQFKNSHDPGARMATSGGPATAARGTASIDGTGMKRKP